MKLEISQGYTTMHGQPIIKTCALLWYSCMIVAVYLLRGLDLLGYGALNFVSSLNRHNSIVILSLNCFPPVYVSLSKPDVLLSLNVWRSTVHVFGCVEF